VTSLAVIRSFEADSLTQGEICVAYVSGTIRIEDGRDV
jgi:hypothetical protein